MDERRKYKRVYVRFTVECRGQHVWQKTEAINISEGGLFVITDKIEPVDTPVEVIFLFGKKVPRFIYAEGTVVWLREKESSDASGKALPSGMGLEFKSFYSFDFRDFIASEIKEWDDAEE